MPKQLRGGKETDLHANVERIVWEVAGYVITMANISELRKRFWAFVSLSAAMTLRPLLIQSSTGGMARMASRVGRRSDEYKSRSVNETFPNVHPNPGKLKISN